MQKAIFITGATDGIGLATAKMLVAKGHHLLIHGRDPEKLNTVQTILSELPNAGPVKSYLTDLSQLAEVKLLAEKLIAENHKLDVLINNAGVFKVSNTLTEAGLDVRFAVNTVAPFLLTKSLIPLLKQSGRVINLSSAAQAPVNIDVLFGRIKLSDMEAYAQSKLAITIWTQSMARSFKDKGVVMIAVNPGSMLGSKMVQQGFAVAGSDLDIGAEILSRIALDDEFALANGKYFDNDTGRFSSPHADVMNSQKLQEVVEAIETILAAIR